MNVLSIQSHVAYGHVGNSAAVFAMQRLGVEVWPLHTLQYSNHPGHGRFRGRVFDGAHIAECVSGLEDVGAFAACGGVLSGYLGTREAGEAALEAVRLAKAANPAVLYACDPVLGDAGPGVYVSPDLVAFLRDVALPHAVILTPSLFELGFLAQIEVREDVHLMEALARLHARGPRLILVTSASLAQTPEGMIDTVLSQNGGACHRIRTPRLQTAVNGAGDCIAALFLARLLLTGNASRAASLAVSSVFGILSRTADEQAREMVLIAAQDEIIAPSWIFDPETL